MPIAAPLEAATAESVGTKTLFTVQALRAIAAAGVLTHHVGAMLAHNAGYALGNKLENGAAGVDLFFCIIGFVMVYTHADDFLLKGQPEPSSGGGSFALRRFTG